MSARAFKSIRTRLGVSQSVIAEALGVTQGNVSFYEKGQTIPPPVAGRLIEFAKSRGHLITYDDIYAANDDAGHEAAADAPASFVSQAAAGA